MPFVAAFSIRLAHVAAQQHNWEASKGQLEQAAGQQQHDEASPAIEWLGAELHRVRGAISAGQGQHRRAMEELQAAAERATAALQRGNSSACATAPPHRKAAAFRGRPSKQNVDQSRAGSQKALQVNSAGIAQESGLQRPLASQLAGIRVQQAAASMSLGDTPAASEYLNAAAQACEELAGTAFEQGLPIEAARIGYYRASVLAGSQDSMSRRTDGEAHLWGASNLEIWQMPMEAPKKAAAAGRGSRARKGRLVAMSGSQHSSASAMDCDESQASMLQQLLLLLKSYTSSKNVPHLSRCDFMPVSSCEILGNLKAYGHAK